MLTYFKKTVSRKCHIYIQNKDFTNCGQSQHKPGTWKYVQHLPLFIGQFVIELMEYIGPPRKFPKYC